MIGVVEPFVLDLAANPHQDLLDLAQRARRIALMMPTGGPMFLAMFMYWQGVLDAMCAATGERPEQIVAWMDFHAEPAPKIASAEGQSVNIARR